MKISLNWLAEYVELPKDVDALAKLLTFAGLEVEAIDRPGEALKGVVVAQILASDKHPNAEKLSVTKVDAGTGTPLQIVCGAKNYKVGDKVPLATVGTSLPGGMNIKQAALRGVDSFGMLCSAKELGFSQDHEGLLILDPALKPGTPIATALGKDDVTFELNVTPNRPDALSHLGVAREVAALTGKPLKLPPETLRETGGAASKSASVRIDDAVRCPRYAARVIEGVKVAPSPKWMAERLEACGVRAINNLVDVTNYVMLEAGQPLHAFDLDQIAQGQIVVRTAQAGEKLTTLDAKQRALDADDLLICDAQKPLVLAGVMGGASSEVTEKTTRVLLECANFQPATVRRASKRHALHTESSHRFERGCDIGNIGAVIDRAAALIAELGGGSVKEGRVDAYPAPVEKRTVTLRTERMSKALGTPVTAEEARKILEPLGFIRAAGADEDKEQTFDVPTARVDVAIEEDLIEEVARIRGYDKVPVTLPRGLGALAPEPASVKVERKLRAALSGQGLDEVVNYSFVAPTELAAFKAAEGAVALKNPISAELAVMRTTLFPSLVANVARAVRHQAQGVRFYELARTYRADPEGGKGGRPVAQERLEVGGALFGQRDGTRTWTGKGETSDFYDAKGAVEAVLSALGIDDVTWEPLENDLYHPRAAAKLTRRMTVLGSVGELHPRAAHALSAPAGIFLFQLDVAELTKAARLVPEAHGLSRFPSVLGDLAVVVPVSLAHAAVRDVILEVGKPLVQQATLFDVYTGKPIAEGMKNVAYALEYRAADRTLTDEEVQAAHAKIVQTVNERLGGSLRGA
jgi:phenylalanyl-tRNA synthetase beta chain